MKHVIFHLSLLTRDRENEDVLAECIDAFARLGESKGKMLWHWLWMPSFMEKFFGRGPSLPTLFDRYRRGDYSTEQFMAEIGKKFPQAVRDPERFKQTWTLRMKISERTRQAFAQIKTLEQKGIKVYLLSNTNPLDIEKIEHDYQDKLPGTPVFSYQQKVLGRRLLDDLVQRIRDQDKKVTPQDIALFYCPPGSGPYPHLGWLAWLWAPFKQWEYHGARNYVATLERRRDLTPVNYNWRQDPRIIDQLQQLGWKELMAEEADPTISLVASSTPQPVLVHRMGQITDSSQLQEGKEKKADETKDRKQKALI